MYGLFVHLYGLSLKMKKKDQKANIKRLTVCAMLTALGVILLSIGALLEVLDISMAAVASFCVIITVVEYGKGAPWMVYAATSLLSFLLIPTNLAATFFALFFGFYPILKGKLETRPKAVCWILKELVFNVSLAVILLIYGFFFFKDVSFAVSFHWVVIAAVVLCEIVFVIYDIALTRIINFYVIRLRKKFKFK